MGLNVTIICLYVDNLLVTGSYAQDIDRFKIKMKQGFENLEYCPTGDFTILKESTKSQLLWSIVLQVIRYRL
jgi:hypothetical protein